MNIDNLHIIFEQTDCLYSPQAYLNGELSTDEQYYFEKHILSCSICRDEYEGLLAMNDSKELPAIVSGLNKKIDNYVRPIIKPNFLKKHKILRIAAFILVLIGSGFFINYYTQYSSQEYAAEEMVSQSTEEQSLEPSMALDSLAQPVTIGSTNKPEQKNRLSDQVVKQKISKTASRKKIKNDDDETAAIETMDLVDDEFEIEAEEAYEEDVSGSKISSEAVLAEKSQKELKYTDSKKKPKEEELTETVSTSNYSRAKSSGNTKKTVKGYTVVNYLESGISAYEKAEYEEAIEQFKKSEKYEGQNDKTTYYLGLSYDASGNSKKALKYFNELLKNTQSPYYEDAKWQKALSLIKTGKTKQAVEILNELLKSEVYNKEAQQKLDSLQRK